MINVVTSVIRCAIFQKREQNVTTGEFIIGLHNLSSGYTIYHRVTQFIIGLHNFSGLRNLSTRLQSFDGQKIFTKIFVRKSDCKKCLK